MTQFNAPPVRRSGGDLNVYTAMLAVAAIVLAVGVFVLATGNMEHSAVEGAAGGPFQLVDDAAL